MPSPKEVIENIRKFQFGYGIDRQGISDDFSHYMDANNEFRESATVLSQDINKKEPRLVFELIQNAEDNDYNENVKPTIKFIINSNKLIIQNNEKGFEKEHVEALCRVGGSTKRNRTLGYIGEKGIGFKSVFVMSDEPHIYSNGFRFQFKREKEKHESIIIPHWVNKIHHLNVDTKKTNIVLPLKPEKKTEIKQYIDQIRPSLLLFLKKLKIIEIEDEVQHTYEKIKRCDHNGLIEIEHGEKKSYWRTIKKTFERDRYIIEEKREDIHETEIILAFPLNEDGSADASNEQYVFAFLPVRGYGFKFIIQADFLLPPSREDIKEYIEWNKWLRDSIATVFLDAVNEFKVDKKLRYTFYNYLPLDEVKDDFFLPVVEQIYKELQNIECILTETNQWKKPSDVLDGSEEIRKLVSNEDLTTFFDKEYLSTEIKAKKLILRKLGVEKFSIEKLIKCLENTEWVKKQSDGWFAFLYEYLSSQQLSDAHLEQLKELDVIRLENEELTSIKEGAIFFPLAEEGKGYGFENELRIIKGNIFDIISEREKQEEDLKIKKFLEELDIKPYDPYEIIEKHIWPIYSYVTNYKWKQKDPATLVGYVKYIKDNINAYKEKAPRLLSLKSYLRIRVDKSAEGTLGYELPEDIYLPKRYGNENDLETLFEGINVNFVHPCYIEEVLNESEEKIKSLKSKLKGKSKKNVEEIEEQIKSAEQQRDVKIKEWRDFFIKLGVNKIPKVVDESDEIRDPNPGAQNYGYYNSKLQYKSYLPEDYFKTPYKAFEEITDYKLELDVQRLNLKQRRLFLSILERNWSRYKEDFSKQLVYKHKYLRSSYQWQEDRKDCHFKYSLINIRWLPTTKGTFAKPSEVFLNNPQIKKLLGDSVSYLIDIKNEEFIEALGINSEANVKSVLNSLKVLVEQGCDDKTKFDRLYEFLNGHYFDEDRDRIIQTLSDNALIYIPDVSKKFFKIHEVIWKDVSDIFGEIRGYLGRHYPDLKYFFVEKLGVSEKLSPRDYAKVLEDLSQKEKIISEDEQIILKIYKELNYHLNPENNVHLISREDWWKGFVSEPIFWTDKEKWKNDEDVFVNDDEVLYKLFKDNPRLAFLKLPENCYPKIQHFLKAVGVPYLSKVEPKLATDETARIEQNLTKQIQTFALYILRYLYQLEHDRYERLKREGILTQLKNLTCCSIENLQVEYILNQQPALTQRKALLYKGKLYIQNDRLEDTDHLAVELSKLFGELRGLDDFLITLFEKRTEDKIKKLLEAKGIGELPEEEQKWFGIEETISVGDDTEVETAKENFQEPPGSEKEPKFDDETHFPEGPPIKTFPQGNLIRDRETVITERQIRDLTNANWVKQNYGYHCQICLSREKPEILTYNKSYAGPDANRKSLMEAHHIKEVAKDSGHDHPGNYLSLCHHHHVLLHNLKLSLDDVNDSLRNVEDKEIEWPNGEMATWKILTLSNKFVEGNQAIQIVINQEHLEKLKEYQGIIYKTAK